MHASGKSENTYFVLICTYLQKSGKSMKKTGLLLFFPLPFYFFSQEKYKKYK
jgi:hypothetical protein